MSSGTIDAQLLQTPQTGAKAHHTAVMGKVSTRVPEFSTVPVPA